MVRRLRRTAARAHSTRVLLSTRARKAFVTKSAACRRMHLLLPFRSAIALPKTDYPLFDALPARLTEEGLLSKLQLEGILYACAVRRFCRERSATCVP